MSSVDDRIVNMQFNNKQFTQGAADSTKALDGLEKALVKTASSKGLDGLGRGVEQVSAKFSMMQVAGVTALANIANKMTNMGLNFMKDMSGINAAKAGLSEYERTLEATQTIMSGTGESVQQVSKTLKELNDYSDRTIYAFGDMTSNIKHFTNAGLSSKKAASTMMGIANAAAAAGAGAAEAGRAMYGFGQSMSMGFVGLQDWNQIDNAGIATKEFKEELIKSGIAAGTLTKGLDGTIRTAKGTEVTYKNLRTTLQDQWATSEALVSTLNRYSDTSTKVGKKAAENATRIKTLTQLMGVLKESAQSGWAQSWFLIFGNLKQASKLWTSVGDAVGGVFQSMADKRNAMLEAWNKDKDFGRTELFDSLGRIATSLGSVFKALGAAFRDVFPPSSFNIMIAVTKGLSSFSKSIVPSKDTLKDLQSIFGAVLSVFKIAVGIVGGVATAFGKLFGAILSGSGQASGGLLSMLGFIGEIIVGFQKWLTETANIQEVLGGIGSIVGAVLKPLVSAVGLIVEAFSSLAIGDVSGFTAPFEQAKGALLTFVGAIAGGIAKLTEPFGQISEFFTNLQIDLEALASKISSPFETASQSVGAFKDQISSLGMGGLSSAGDSVSKGFDRVRSSSTAAKDAVSGLYDSFKSSTASEAAETSLELASAGERASVRWDAVGTLLLAVGGTIKDIFTALGEAAQWVGKQFSGLFGGMDALDWASVMNALFTGGVILSIRSFVKKLEDFTFGLSDIKDAIVDTFGQLTDTLKTMQQAVKAEMIRNIAIAVALLTASVIALTFVDTKKLAISLGAIGIMLGMLVGALYGLGKVESEMNMGLIAASILMISAAMVNLAIAVSILGRQDLPTLAKGLGAMAIAMGIMVASMKALSGISGKLASAGASIVLIAVAMNILAGAVAMFGNMDMGTLAKGFGSLAVGLGIIVPALLLLSLSTGGVIAASAAITTVSGAMMILALAVASFGNMDMGTLAKGFGSVAIGLALMTASLLILSPMAPQVFVVAQAMALLSAAMIGLAFAVGVFGTMDIQTLAIGFGAVALGLGLLIAAAAGAMLVAPGLAILSSSIMMLGAAMALAGLGMLAFGTGLVLLTVAGTAAVGIIVTAIQAFVAMLPSIAQQVAAAFVSFLEVIANASPRIRKSIGEIFKNVLGVIRDAIPEIRALLSDLLQAGLQVIGSYISDYAEMGWSVIDEFLNSAEKHVPDIVDSALALATNFLKVLEKRIPELQEQGAKTIIAFIQGTADAIDNNVDDLRTAALDLARAIINGLTGGLLDEGMAKVKSAVSALADSIPGPIKKILGIASPSKVTTKLGGHIAEGLARGISSGIKSAVGAAIRMANAVIAAGDKAVLEVQKKARAAQQKADSADAKADILAKRAAARRKAADAFAKKNPKNKKAIAEQNKAARALENQAARQRKNADRAQVAADNAAQKVVDTQTFNAADNVGKGDIKQDQAVSLASAASRMLSKANAEAEEARRLMKTNKKAGRAMLAQARKDAQRARELAKQAKAANDEANDWYEKDVEARIQQLKDDAEFEAADDKGKAAILQARAEANDAKAAEQKALMQTLLAEAEALADTNAAEALRLVALAEEAAKSAQEAADQAASERQQAEQITNPGSSGGSPGQPIEPSRSVLDDAARAVDRYTESLRQAEELVAAQQPVVQFIQNNTSPEALNVSEVYRNSKNLLSAAEIKMGVPTTT